MNVVRLKFWRITILACVLIAVLLVGYLIHGKFFYESDKVTDFSIQPLGPGFSLGNSSLNSSEVNKLASYPSPDQFRTFDPKEGSLRIASSCSDQYYVVLIFEQDVDYRKNPQAAKYNRAFPCPISKNFNLTIEASDLTGRGAYYYMVADENETQTWYNPR